MTASENNSNALRRQISKSVREIAEYHAFKDPQADAGEVAKSLNSFIGKFFGYADDRDEKDHRAALDWLLYQIDRIHLAIDSPNDPFVYAPSDDWHEVMDEWGEELNDRREWEWKHEVLHEILTEDPGSVWAEIYTALTNKFEGYLPVKEGYVNYEWRDDAGWHEALDGGFQARPIPGYEDDDDVTRWYVK